MFALLIHCLKSQPVQKRRRACFSMGGLRRSVEVEHGLGERWFPRLHVPVLFFPFAYHQYLAPWQSAALKRCLVESWIHLSAEFAGRELGGLTPLPWSPADTPGVWLLSFLMRVSKGASSPFPTTLPTFGPRCCFLQPFELPRRREAAAASLCLLPQATAAFSSAQASGWSQGGGMVLVLWDSDGGHSATLAMTHWGTRLQLSALKK